MSARRSPALPIAEALWATTDALRWAVERLEYVAELPGRAGFALLDAWAYVAESPARARSSAVVCAIGARAGHRLASSALSLVVAFIRAHRRVWRPGA